MRFIVGVCTYAIFNSYEKKKILRIGHLSEKQEKGDGKTEKWKERQGKMEAFKIKH